MTEAAKEESELEIKGNVGVDGMPLVSVVADEN